MKINRNNYESFFLDYIEGNLSNEEIAELKVFISENKDLKEELNEFEAIHISTEKLRFEEKEHLKINFPSDIKITSENIDEFSVAFYENDLTSEKKEEVEYYLKKHPEKKQEFELFSKTKLNPDYSIKFPDSDSLFQSIETEKVTDKNFKEFCIAYHENLISEKGRKKLIAFINTFPKKKQEFDTFKKVYLLPDKSITFKNKNALKKNKTIRLLPAQTFKYVVAVAALLVLFFALYNSNNSLWDTIKKTAQTDKIKPLSPVQKNKKYAQITNHDKKSKPSNKKNITKPVKKTESKQDSVLKKQNKLKNLKPFTIENYHNVRFSFEQKPQNIINNQVSIAEVKFNFENTPEQELPVTKNKYLTIGEYLAERAKKFILQDNYDESKKINYLDVAQAGINEIDKIIPGKIEFDYKSNKNGQVEYFALNTPLFGYSKEFNR